MGERGARQLPPGRHGLPRDYVAENQRERILAAAAEAVAEAGYAESTVESVVARAGVSRRTFYQHFGNKEEAVLAAYDAFAGRVMATVDDAQRGETGGFREQAETVLRTVLDVLAEHPAQTYLLVVEALAVSPAAIERRAATLRTLVQLVHRTTCALAVEQDLQPPPVITAEAVVGGLAEVIYNRVRGGGAGTLPTLLPDLLYCTLLPYLGQEAAAAEHRRLSTMVSR